MRTVVEKELVGGSMRGERAPAEPGLEPGLELRRNMERALSFSNSCLTSLSSACAACAKATHVAG